MTRFLAVHGLGLDRAYPELGSGLGDQLRQWSAALLADVGQAVSRTEADYLLLVGGLFDRSTLTPATLEYVTAVLGSVGVPVIVVPGRSDWYGDGSPYVNASWPDNVSIVSSSIPMPYDHGTPLWASAWTGPTESSVVLPPELGATGTALLVRPDIPEPDTLATRLPAAVQLLTTTHRPGTGDRAMVVAPLVSLDGRASARLLTLQGDAAWEDETVDLGDCPVLLTHVDVTGLTEDGDVRAAVLAAMGGAPAVVRLSGTLSAGVLPPSLHAAPLPSHVVVDEGELHYPTMAVEEDERTTRAEFLRAMASLLATPRQRHVATALGLQALAVTEG